MGNLAFDRRSNRYIAFDTETDAMLASLVLAYRLAPPILELILAIVRRPSFRPSDITISKPGDILERIRESVPTRSSQSPANRMTIPRVVFEHVVEIFQAERAAKCHACRDMEGPRIGRLYYSDVRFTMSSNVLRGLKLYTLA